jgi:hypothetical protein
MLAANSVVDDFVSMFLNITNGKSFFRNVAENGKLLSVFYPFRIYLGNIVDFGGISRIFCSDIRRGFYFFPQVFFRKIVYAAFKGDNLRKGVYG